MNTLEQMEALQDAVTLLKGKRQEIVKGTNAVWLKLYNASEYLDKQMRDCLTME